MIVREKHTGEEWSYPLELELSPGPDWEFQEGKRLSVRHKVTGEVRYPDLGSQWCIHLPELEETEYVPTQNLARRHTGNWNLVVPGDDSAYEFIPTNDDERRTLLEYGFTITEK